MSPHSPYSADNEPTDCFDEDVVRRAIQAIEEDTDPGNHGHYDEVDLYGTMDPAPPRTTDEVQYEILEEEEETAPLGLLVGLAGASMLAASVAAFAVAGSIAWLVLTNGAEQAEVIVAPTEEQLVGQEATNAHIDAVLEEKVVADAAAPAFELRTVPVEFGFDSWQANIEQSALSTLATDIQTDLDAARSSDGDGKLVLTGHTDSRGSASANEIMGLGRAWAVQVVLVSEGVDGQIELVGAGESKPIATNDSAEGRATNRRVTAEVFGPIPPLSDVFASK